ncbi:MAG: hypothetical protein E2590_11580 [Chryseobacterium sp.]|uniref:hypothetical protein n=1 Tax=Epilithonimonas caeni TaxID=365343 RepID=UPI00041EB093|nr:hypothetical protein [Epilithonimonas caeni]MPS73773.1 hypothetical protein [Chryseobacterium sp.]
MSNNEKLATHWTLLSQMLPPLGIILYFRHRNSFPKKAKQALRSALIGIPVGFAVNYLFFKFILK